MACLSASKAAPPPPPPPSLRASTAAKVPPGLYRCRRPSRPPPPPPVQASSSAAARPSWPPLRLPDATESVLASSAAAPPGSPSLQASSSAARPSLLIRRRPSVPASLWDLNMDSGPVSTFQVHEHLRPKLCDLYENDSIFDKFECCLSGDGLRVATGSYGNIFRVFGCTSGSAEATTLEASRNPMRRQITNPTRPTRTLTSFTHGVCRGGEN